MLKCIFDQQSKLHSSLDAKPDIQILNWLYFTSSKYV